MALRKFWTSSKSIGTADRSATNNPMTGQPKSKGGAAHEGNKAQVRVMSISHSAVNRVSGRKRYEAIAMQRRDIDLTVVAPDHWWEYGAAMPLDPPVGPLDFRVERIRLAHLPLVAWNCHHYLNLGNVLRQIRPEVLHLWEEPWSFVALQAARLRDRLLPHTALLFETEQNILRRLPPPFEQIRRYTLGRTNLLIGRQAQALDVARACGFSGPTAIVEYGVDADIFARRDRDQARRTMGFHGFTLGYVGRVIQPKGLETAIAAIALCNVPVSLVILGTGSAQDALLRQARELGVADRVRFLGMAVPSQVAQVMNGLDALVLLSRTTRSWKEQFGRVIMEAHACGVPVIGSDSGSIPGVVGEGGWIVPEGDAAALGRLLSPSCWLSRRDSTCGKDRVMSGQQAIFDRNSRRKSCRRIRASCHYSPPSALGLCFEIILVGSCILGTGGSTILVNVR